MTNFLLYLLVSASVAVALILSVLPTPADVAPFRPEWVLLVVIYWCLALPGKFNIAFAWFIGIFVDVLDGVLIGQHALAYTVVAYAAVYFHPRFRVYPLIQQSLAIGALLLPYFLIIRWVEGIVYSVDLHWQHWMPVVTSVLFWPWVFSMLRFIRQKTPAEN